MQLNVVNYSISMLLMLLGSAITARIQNKMALAAFNCIYGAIVIIFAHGFVQLYLIYIIFIVNYICILTRRFRPHLYTAMNILFLFAYEKLYKDVIGLPSEFDLTGPLFMLVIKSTYASAQYNQNPIDLFNYIFMVPGILAGPAIEYDEFIRIQNSQQPKVEANFLLLIAKSLVGILIYFVLDGLNLTNRILSSNSFIIKTGYLFLMSLRKKSSLYAVWTWASACFCLINIEITNIDVTKVEFTSEPMNLPRYWNSCTNKFLRDFYFKDLLEKGYRKEYAAMMCFIISSCMHSSKMYDFIFFITASLTLTVLNRIFSRIEFIGRSRILRTAIITFIFMYFIVAKATNNTKECFAIWKEMKYVGHVLLVFLYLLSLFFERKTELMHRKKEKTN
ncbi:ALE1 [Enterospora canceri]|uniref:ALE1 n=1 Tax=Enterospora canceri TaxID=1081671 RepID=A0A1Y1S6Y9_9MICR|nr:ALE1 [Enterospora canceri]